MNENVKKIIEITETQNRWRKKECLNMIPSENITSPLCDQVYLSDFSHRYAEGLPFKRFYQGVKYVDEIEDLAIKLTKKLFKAKNADLRPISGSIANLAVFKAWTSPGDKIVSCSIPSGAHVSHTRHGCAGVVGLTDHSFPFDNEKMNIDVDGARKLIREVKPKLIVFGASLWIFPYPVKELMDDIREVGAKVVYDAAHVLGLIAGGQFQDPLKEGVDVVTSSTHKTFFGPQGGIVFGNTSDEDWEKIQDAIFPGLVCNHHLHRLPATAIALAEFLEFGKDYAEQVVKNSQVLASAMDHNNHKILGANQGFTKSHQVLWDVSDIGGGKVVAELLEKNNIICNKNMFPWDKLGSEKMVNPSGVRMGVQELTRWGMKEKEMRTVADLMDRAAKGENVKKDVIELKSEFNEVNYTFR